MTAYTNIPKPTDSNYIGVYTQGKQNYDDPTISFDDIAVFYDSTNYSAYTTVNKPNGYMTLTPGMTMGLLIPLTNPVNREIGQPYVKINKPTT